MATVAQRGTRSRIASRNLQTPAQRFAGAIARSRPPAPGRPSTGGGVTFKPPGVPATGGGLELSRDLLTGNQQVRGDTAGATNVLFGESDFISQFLNPSILTEQEDALDALRKTSAARGLAGGAVDKQIESATDRFLAGNRRTAISGLQEEGGARIEAFRQQIDPFLSRFGRGSGQQSTAQEQEASLFGGFTSLGLGDLVRSEQFRRAGGQAGQLQGLGSSGGLANTAENAGLLGAFNQFFNPSVSGNLPTSLVPFETERKLNQGRGGAELAGFLDERLSGLSQGLDELGIFGLGAGLASDEDLLGADVSRFGEFFGGTGQGLFGRGPDPGFVQSGNAAGLLNQASRFSQFNLTVGG